MRDFKILQDAGREARLTVGPWTHLSMDSSMMLEAIEFGLPHARGIEPPPRLPVRLFVMGEDAWRDFESWPPAGYAPQRFHLQPDGGLSTSAPLSGSSRFRYDPADPTPAVGGVRMVRGASGRVDNTSLEARSDVLTFTTPPLEQDVEVIGEITAEIWFRSSLQYADLFVRLCDVDTLWPTAHRFKAGHRIRVQVSSGAHPRFTRNPGTGESPATATKLIAADQTVHHSPDYPSAILLRTHTVQ